MIKKIILILFICLLYNSCTRDDICPEDTPATPLLIVKFMDISNPTQVKTVTNLQVTLANIEQTEVISATSDTIFRIPLNPSVTNLQYNFTENFGAENPNTDAITFNYQNSEDVYINRACGFRTTFTNVTAAIQPEGSANWMLNTIITNATVENEDVTHITIFH